MKSLRSVPSRDREGAVFSLRSVPSRDRKGAVFSLRSVPSRDREGAVFCAHSGTARVSERTSAKSYGVTFSCDSVLLAAVVPKKPIEPRE